MELALIERAKVDPEAFGELYRQHHLRLFRFVFARAERNGMLAEDLTADVFVRALAALPRYEDQGQPFSGWLFRIAVNRISDHYRGAVRECPNGSVVDVLAAMGRPLRSHVDVIAQQDLAMTLRPALAALAPRQRMAVALRYGWGMRNAQVAVAMGTTEGAVKLLVHRGLAAMRGRLAELEDAA